MELKHVVSYHGGEVVMRVHDDIGFDPETYEGINGAIFAAEVAYVDSLHDTTGITISINSQGGSIVDGLSMCAAIRAAKNPTTTVVDGIALSSAAFIAMSGDTRKMVDFGRMMVHNPSMRGEAIQDHTDPKIVAALNAFADMLAENMSKRSGKTTEEVLALMDAETWMTASEAIEAGFIDSIVSTEMNDILASFDMNKADLREVVNTITQKHDLVNLKEINAALGLDSATAGEVTAKHIKALLSDNEELKTLREFKAAAEADATATLAARVEAVVDAAISAKKITKGNRDYVISQGMANLAALEDFISNQPVIAARLKPNASADTGKVVDGKLDGKSLRELERENPTALAALRTDSPEDYKALYKAQYGAELSD